MRYLRMLTNSVLGAALGAAYLTVLLLQLNPQVPLLSLSVGRWFARMMLYYGVNLTVLFYGFIVVRELLATRPLGPGWISVRVLAWMAALTAGAASFLMWSNLRGFETVLDADAARRMLLGTVATTGSAVVLAGIAIVRYSFGRRGSGVSAALLALAVAGSLVLPLAARGVGVERPLGARPLGAALASPEPAAGAPRVRLILLDGASLDYLWARVTDGRFPNFGRILDAGAAVDLATLRPTQAEPVWTAVATGKYPPHNGVRSAATYRIRTGGAPVALSEDPAQPGREGAPHGRRGRRDRGEVTFGDLRDDGQLPRHDRRRARHRGIEERHLAHVLTRLQRPDLPPADQDRHATGEHEVEVVVRRALLDEDVVGRKLSQRDALDERARERPLAADELLGVHRLEQQAAPSLPLEAFDHERSHRIDRGPVPVRGPVTANRLHRTRARGRSSSGR